MKQAARKSFNTSIESGATVKRAPSAAAFQPGAAGGTPAVTPRTRHIHKPGEVNISAYFPAEVKASLRNVQAKAGYKLKDCLAEALRALFQKHNVPLSVRQGEGH